MKRLLCQSRNSRGTTIGRIGTISRLFIVISGCNPDSLLNQDWTDLGDILESRHPSEEEVTGWLQFLREEKGNLLYNICKIFLIIFICLLEHLKQVYFVLIPGVASSSLWVYYSMLNSIMKSKYDVSLKKHPRITVLLKSYDTDCKKKASTFSKESFDTFVGNCSISTPYWLVLKVCQCIELCVMIDYIQVIMITAYFGGLRHTETDGLKIENFVTTKEGVIVTHARSKVNFLY